MFYHRRRNQPNKEADNETKSDNLSRGQPVGNDYMVENTEAMYSSPTTQSDLYMNIERQTGVPVTPEAVYEDAPDVPSKHIIGEHYMDTVIQNGRPEFERGNSNVSVPLESMYTPAPTVPSKDIIGENYMETVIQNRKMSNNSAGKDSVNLNNDNEYYNLSASRPAIAGNKASEYEDVSVDVVHDIDEIIMAENELYG